MNFVCAFVCAHIVFICWDLYSHWSSRKAAAVFRFDSKEICSKWAHPSADACGGQGDDDENGGGEEEDEERQQAGGRAVDEQRQDSKRCLTLKRDSCGISTPWNRISAPFLWMFQLKGSSSDCSSLGWSEDWLCIWKVMTFKRLCSTQTCPFLLSAALFIKVI